MSQRVYRVRQLVSAPNRPGILPIGSATLWRWVREGDFPQPFKLGGRVTVWDAAEVEAYLARKRQSREAA